MSEATAAVEPILDSASEAILEGVDGVVETLEVVRNNPVTLALVAGVAGAFGCTVGVLYGRHHFKKVYEDLSRAEIAEAREFFARLNKVDMESGDVLSPMQVLERTHPEAAADALRTYRGLDGESPSLTEEDLIQQAAGEHGSPWDQVIDEQQMGKIEARSLKADKIPADRIEETVVEEKVETVNVFSDPQFDLEEETKYRTGDKPYVITHDEYFAGEKNYEMVLLTYFETDDTLVDEEETPIPDVDKAVGDDQLVRFGHGSMDKNVVYVRNDKRGIDYEITRSPGSYLEEVLGLTESERDLKRQAAARRSFNRGDG